MCKFRSDSVDRLFETILALEIIEECYEYFEDICTIKEVQDMAQRLEAAILLRKGAGYQAICDQVGLSTATIGRVSKCLKYGTGGYERAIARLEEKQK